MPRKKIDILFFASSNGIVYKKDNGKINSNMKSIIFDKFNSKCNICNHHVKKYRNDVKFLRGDRMGNIDHILPIARGGLTNIDNLQLLCESCNQKKGAK